MRPWGRWPDQGDRGSTKGQRDAMASTQDQLSRWRSAFIGLILALSPRPSSRSCWNVRPAWSARSTIGRPGQALRPSVGQQQSSIIEAAQQVLSSMAAHDAVRALHPSAECDAFLRRLVDANPRYLVGQRSLTAKVNRSASRMRRRAASTSPTAPISSGRCAATASKSAASPSAGQRVSAACISQRCAMRPGSPSRSSCSRSRWIGWWRNSNPCRCRPAAQPMIADRDGMILARSVDPDRLWAR